MANTAPIYTGTPEIQGVVIGTQNTRSDGNGTIGTDIWLAFTADATEGSFVSKIRFNPIASVAATATAATVLRVFIADVTSGATTSSNCRLFQEIPAGAQTAAQTTTATFFHEIPLNFGLKAGQSILVTTHVANNANTNWQALVFGGDY